jgi:hypothetical protein
MNFSGLFPGLLVLTVICIFRSDCAAAIMGDTIVAMGGYTVNQNRSVKTKTAEYLVLGENTWKKLPPMHCDRAGATACPFP